MRRRAGGARPRAGRSAFSAKREGRNWGLGSGLLLGAPRTEATSTKYKLSTAARKTQDSKRQVRDDTEHRVQLLTFYIAILAVYGTDCTELSVPLVYSRSVNKPNGAGAVWVRAYGEMVGGKFSYFKVLVKY